MTKLTKAIWRRTVEPLDGSFGSDAGKPLALALVPARGNIPEQIAMRPLRARGRTEYASLPDLYRWLVRCRVNRELLEKARDKKARKAQRLADARQARAERRLVHEA